MADPKPSKTTRTTHREEPAAEVTAAPPLEPEPSSVETPEVLSVPVTEWQQERFLEACRITSEQVESVGITWEELAAIYDDHKARADSLRRAAVYVVEHLQGLSEVHSVRVRVKDPAGLVRKVLRKRTDDRPVGFSNYRTEVTDLVGVRALHLYKVDWVPIHKALKAEWNTVEPPRAYIREGDPQTWIDAYENGGCVVEAHERQYRSVHYLLTSSPSKTTVIVEVQVRTLFEEGWAEVDHRVNYPEAASAEVGLLLGVLNRLAGAADEMGDLAERLNELVRQREADLIQVREGSEQTINALQSKLDQMSSALGQTAEEKAALRSQIDDLRRQVTALSTPTSFTPSPENRLNIESFVDFRSALSPNTITGIFGDPSATVARRSAFQQMVTERYGTKVADPQIVTK